MALRRAITLAPATLPVWSNLLHTLLYSDRCLGRGDSGLASALRYGARHDFGRQLRRWSCRSAPRRRPRLDCASAFSRPTCAGTRWAISSNNCSSTTTARRSRSSAITTASSMTKSAPGSPRMRRAGSRRRGLNDDELAARIAGDGLDVLIELAGHTGLRLRVLARRLAPVQATWLGYPGTTGLSAIDFRLTDARADPPAHEALHSERLVRLPHSYYCYRPRGRCAAAGAAARARARRRGDLRLLQHRRQDHADDARPLGRRTASGATIAAAAEGGGDRVSLGARATAGRARRTRRRRRAHHVPRVADAGPPGGLRRSGHRPRHVALQRRDDDVRSAMDGRSRGHRRRRPFTGADGREHPHRGRLRGLDRDGMPALSRSPNASQATSTRCRPSAAVSAQS